MTSSLRRRAFTLIELLIVITIIGILAVALIPRLTGGPARARDAQRQSDLQQIATALEFLSNDKGGYTYVSGCVSTAGTVTMTDLSSYLTTVPSDPNYSATGGLVAGEFDTGACATGYSYVGLRGTGAAGLTNYSASGYLLATDLETETTRASGVYAVNGGAFDVDNTLSASSNFAIAANLAKLCSTSACAGTNVIYVVGR